MKRILTAVLLLGMLTATNSRCEEKVLSIGNGDFSATIVARDGRISATSLAVKSRECPAGRELLKPDGAPLFEFSVNGRTVSSDMPLWTYSGMEEQHLSNGGTIATYKFEGRRELRGLTLLLDREYFPEGAFIRERLRLESEKPGKFRLTDVGGRNHFIFPRYTFIGRGSKEVTEIRMGSYGLEVLQDYDTTRTDDRRPRRNLATCHMFHPDFRTHDVEVGDTCEVKGPFLLMDSDNARILTSYEHASQDISYMTGKSSGADASISDAFQGVQGESETVTDDDLWFIATRFSRGNDSRTLQWHIRRGGYLDGEAIPSGSCYETVWSTLTVLSPEESPTDAIKDYLLDRISDNKESRKPHFYYNTWGMQRDFTPDMREAFTQERIAREIRYAAETGVDIFIFDDGWQQTMGDWRANSERLPGGLEPLVDSVRSHGMIPGVWLSLMGIDPDTERAEEHPEWIITDMNGEPYAAQWNFPAFDLVGGFYDCILEDLKRLTDCGIRFFKWDAINTFNSALPGLGHGGPEYSRKERIDRYNYLLPFYVTKLMRELREYCPDVVVEIDLTEPERALIGLMPLQEGKFFWMNNGASGYGDYSTFRTKSMRNSINAMGCLLPPELLTYAVYPHNKAPYSAQRYNTNTILQAGHGIWGDLSAMSCKEREYVGNQIGKAKRVLEHTAGRPLKISGQIGAAPETYLQAAPEKGYALFTAFSGSPAEHTEYIDVDTEQVLGVLNHAYREEGGRIRLDLQFAAADDTREAFVVGNGGCGVRVLSSTGWIDRLEADGGRLSVRCGSDSHLRIKLPEGASGIRADVPFRQDTDGTITLFLPAGQDAKFTWKVSSSSSGQEEGKK